MAEIFKKIGMGFLYVICLPFFLVALILFGVYGVGLFFAMLVKAIILFFKGIKITGELEEDIEARKILAPVREKPNYQKKDPIVIIDTPRQETIIREESTPTPIPVYEEPKLVEEKEEEIITPLIEEKEEEHVEEVVEPEADETSEEEIINEPEEAKDVDDNLLEEFINDEKVDEEESKEEEEEIPFLEEEDTVFQEIKEDDEDKNTHSRWRRNK